MTNPVVVGTGERSVIPAEVRNPGPCTISVACKSTWFSSDFHKRLLLRLQP